MPADGRTDSLHPTEAELQFLKVAYERFYVLFEQIMDEEFQNATESARFSKLTTVFSLFTELTKYKPIEWSIEQLRASRPPGEAELATDVVKFVRHVVVHYPLFDCWQDAWISGQLAAWDGQSVYSKVLEGICWSPAVQDPVLGSGQEANDVCSSRLS